MSGGKMVQSQSGLHLTLARFGGSGIGISPAAVALGPKWCNPKHKADCTLRLLHDKRDISKILDGETLEDPSLH
jgi:hypothetical protein